MVMLGIERGCPNPVQTSNDTFAHTLLLLGETAAVVLVENT